MRSSRFARLALVVATAYLFLSIGGQAQAAPGAAPAPAPAVAPAPAPAAVHGTIRVAVANPGQILAQMSEKKAMQDKLEARRKELEQQGIQLRGTLDALMKRKGETNPNHPSYIEILDAIEAGKADLQAFGTKSEASLEREHKFMLKQLYDKIEAAVGEVAQHDGIDLIICDGRTEMAHVEDIPSQEVHRELSARIVLYAAKNVDISEEVITLLNAKYAKAGVATSVPPPIPTR